MRSYVVPVDFSKRSYVALDYAIARARRRKAKLILLHVIKNAPLAGATVEVSDSAELIAKAQEIAREDARKSMRNLVERKKLTPREYRAVLIEHLDAASAIAAQARKSRARMIIMGSEGRTGFQRIFSGSVAEATLRATQRPLLIVKKNKIKKPSAKAILVPIDLSKVSERSVKHAKEIAKAEKESLVLLHVVTESARMVPFYMRKRYQQSLFKEEHVRIKQLARRLGIAPHKYRAIVVRARDAAQAIAKEAKKLRVSMIVMGSHGRTGLTHMLLGSVAEKILRYAACPVLIFKK